MRSACMCRWLTARPVSGTASRSAQAQAVDERESKRIPLHSPGHRQLMGMAGSLPDRSPCHLGWLARPGGSARLVDPEFAPAIKSQFGPESRPAAHLVVPCDPAVRQEGPGLPGHLQRQLVPRPARHTACAAPVRGPRLGQVEPEVDQGVLAGRGGPVLGESRAANQGLMPSV
jgi:hypothetical protein